MRISCIFSFFFECHAYHRDLHSFPTRRSSDLSERARTVYVMTKHAIEGLTKAMAVELAPKGRSEEHTSELQSHSDLVCRLLLEKKKKRIRRDDKERTPTIDVPSRYENRMEPCR